MMTNFEMVKEWHKTFGVPIGFSPQPLLHHRQQLRISLIKEEFKEYRKAVRAGDVVGAADGIADLLYVTYGAAVEHGFPADALFKEVQRSNMSKLGADGKPIYRDSDKKVLKGPNFSLPNFDDVLRAAGWNG